MSNSTVIETPQAVNRGGKYLTFCLEPEEYGLEIRKVREIIGYLETTAVPHTPAHVKGVINLRGQVVGVIDLRARLNMPAVPRTEQTCIIVVEINIDNRKVCMGIIVDRVSEVLNIPAQQIEDAPNFGSCLATDYILGVAKCSGSVKILLKIDQVVSHQAATGFNGAKTSGGN
jgi:purine-binding chemotaxis protein CheW